MQIHVVEWEAAPTVSPLLTLLRAQLTALTFLSPYLTEAEKLRANHHIHECEDAERLQLWLRTIPAELAQREATYYGVYERCSVPNFPPHSLNIYPQAPLCYQREATYNELCSVNSRQPHALNTRLYPTLHS